MLQIFWCSPLILHGGLCAIFSYLSIFIVNEKRQSREIFVETKLENESKGAEHRNIITFTLKLLINYVNQFIIKSFLNITLIDIKFEWLKFFILSMSINT
jgi:hypothetical protein